MEVKPSITIPLYIPFEVAGTQYQSIQCKCPTYGNMVSFQKVMHQHKSKGDELAGTLAMGHLLQKIIISPPMSPDEFEEKLSMPDFTRTVEEIQSAGFLGTSPGTEKEMD